MTLAEKAEHYYNANDHEALFQLAVQSWPADGGDLPEGIAEVCRHASVRAAQMKREDHHLWRARAMTAAVLQGSRDTAAGLLLHAFFVTTIITLEQGSREGHEHARKILDLMKMLVEDSPRSRLFGRLYHEKRGFSLLMEASNGGAPVPASLPLLDAAVAEFARAGDFTQGDERGALKLRGSQALVHYLKLAHHAQHEIESAKQPLLEETRRVMAASFAAGYADIEEWARRNAAMMERGEFVGWTAYDVV